jgi:hypothetical protein
MLTSPLPSPRSLFQPQKQYLLPKRILLERKTRNEIQRALAAVLGGEDAAGSINN